MSRQRTKFSGTVLTEPGPVLRGELVTDYAAWHERRPVQVYYAALCFGDRELARWDVTEHREKFEQQPGDYWQDGEREEHEEAFVEEFLAEKLAPMFAGLEGVIKK